jgi:DNA transformation protein and related proteins
MRKTQESFSMSIETARERAVELAEQIATVGPIGVRRFFSGAGLVARGVHFGFVVRGSLYFRVDDATRPAYEALGAQPFSYANTTKRVTVASYYEVPGEIVDDQDALGRWAAEALRAAQAAARRQAREASLACQAWGKTLTALLFQ